MKKGVIIIAGLACFCNTSLSVMEKWVCFCHKVVSSDCMTFRSDVPSYDTHCHNNYILQTDHTRPEKKYTWCLMNMVKIWLLQNPKYWMKCRCALISAQVRCTAWWHPVWRDEVWISGDNISPITRPFVALSGATDSQTGAGGEISFQFLSVTCILGSHQNNEAEERWDMIPFDYLMIIISKRLSSNITASFIIPPGSPDFFMDVGTRSFVWTPGSGRCLSH